MTWFACGAAAIAVVSSAASASASAKSASKMSVAENEAVIKSNVRNTIRTGYRVGLANMQRGLQKRQEVQAGYDVTKSGQQALGQANANAAASGTIGASADAVVSDIHQKIGDAQASLQEQADVNTVNYQTQIEGITFEGEQSMQEARKSNIQTGSEITSNALMAGVSSLASSYMAGKLKLGASPQGGTPGFGGGDLGSGIRPQSAGLESMGGGSGLKFQSNSAWAGSSLGKQYNW